MHWLRHAAGSPRFEQQRRPTSGRKAQRRRRRRSPRPAALGVACDHACGNPVFESRPGIGAGCHFHDGADERRTRRFHHERRHVGGEHLDGRREYHDAARHAAHRQRHRLHQHPLHSANSFNVWVVR